MLNTRRAPEAPELSSVLLEPGLTSSERIDGERLAELTTPIGRASWGRKRLAPPARARDSTFSVTAGASASGNSSVSPRSGIIVPVA
jgi:hypothetical protein